MHTHITTIARYLLGSAAAAALLTGCHDKTDSAPTTAHLNIVHAAPYVPTTLSVLLDGQAQNNIYYGQRSGYNDVSAGAHTLQMQDVTVPANQVSVPLAADSRKFYSAYVYNSTPTQLGALILTDDMTIPSVGKAHLRFVNMGYGTGRVTLRRLDASATPLVAEASNRNNTGFLVVDPQSADAQPLTLEARDATSQAVLATQTLKIQEGKIYNVVLQGVGATGNAASSLTLSAGQLN